MPRTMYDINKDYSKTELTKLSRYVKVKIAEKTTSLKTLKNIVMYQAFDSVMKGACKNQILTEELCLRIIKNTRHAVTSIFAIGDINPLVLETAMEKYKSLPDHESRIILSNSSCPIKFLEEVYKLEVTHGMPILYIASVLENQNCPTYMIESWYKRLKVNSFRGLFSGNRNTPSHILAEIYEYCDEQDDTFTMNSVACNRNCPDEIKFRHMLGQ